MNIVIGILLFIVAAVLIFVYGRYQYFRGFKDALEEATRILNEQLEVLEEEK